MRSGKVGEELQSCTDRRRYSEKEKALRTNEKIDVGRESGCMSPKGGEKATSSSTANCCESAPTRITSEETVSPRTPGRAVQCPPKGQKCKYCNRPDSVSPFNSSYYSHIQVNERHESGVGAHEEWRCKRHYEIEHTTYARKVTSPRLPLQYNDSSAHAPAFSGRYTSSSAAPLHTASSLLLLSA